MANHINVDSMESSSSYTSKTIDHLGLVAGMCYELDLSNLIDKLTPQDMAKRTVSVGQAVKAMILNGLGFANRVLYLSPIFFKDKPTERVIGPGIQAEHINDDILGRALDTIFDYDTSKLFLQCAIKAMNILKFNPHCAHLDSTSFHTNGKYNSHEEEQECVIRITKGYSCDHRLDLNQLILQVICEGRTGIPLMMETMSGNKSDKENFCKKLKPHAEQLKTDLSLEYIVADSALYVAETLKEISKIWWISRVPETINLTSDIIDALAPI